MSDLQNLPKDMLFELALHLDVDALLKLCTTSKAMSKICGNDELWRVKTKLDFGNVPIRKTWKSTYRRYVMQKRIKEQQKFMSEIDAPFKFTDEQLCVLNELYPDFVNFIKLIEFGMQTYVQVWYFYHGILYSKNPYGRQAKPKDNIGKFLATHQSVDFVDAVLESEIYTKYYHLTEDQLKKEITDFIKNKYDLLTNKKDKRSYINDLSAAVGYMYDEENRDIVPIDARLVFLSDPKVPSFEVIKKILAISFKYFKKYGKFGLIYLRIAIESFLSFENVRIK